MLNLVDMYFNNDKKMIEDNPLISIIIPLYNEENSIKEVII